MCNCVYEGMGVSVCAFFFGRGGGGGGGQVPEGRVAYGLQFGSSYTHEHPSHTNKHGFTNERTWESELARLM